VTPDTILIQFVEVERRANIVWDQKQHAVGDVNFARRMRPWRTTSRRHSGYTSLGSEKTKFPPTQLEESKKPRIS